MLSTRQEQSAQGNSMALQAGRDVHVHGPSMPDVAALCMQLIDDNFPRLRAEANRTAEAHVRELAATLEKRIRADFAQIDVQKLSDPDVQATLNDAVQASARRGDKANPEILAAIISARLTAISTDFKDLVLSEAVHVVPRLTSAQIALISAVQAVTNLRITGTPTVEEIASMGKRLLPCVKSGFGLSEYQRAHLEYAGAASVNNLMGRDWYEEMNAVYKHLGLGSGAAFKALLERSAPSYAMLMDKYVVDHLDQVRLTSVGIAIASASLSNHVGQLGYAWLT